MLSKEKMDRLNALARKSKQFELSEEEKKEQDILRRKYLAKFKKNFKKQLDCIKIVDEKNVEK